MTEEVRFRFAVAAICLTSLAVAMLQCFLPAPLGMLEESVECADGVRRCICPRETVCARDRRAMVLLALSRASAYLNYPLYVLVVLGKAKNLCTALSRTYLAEFVPFHDAHAFHTQIGTVIGLEAFWHSGFHLLRWALDGDLRLALSSTTGVTGVAALVCSLLIVWPMRLPLLRRAMSFELRKNLHALAIVWAACAALHAPASHLFYLMGTLVVVFLVDKAYGALSTTRVQARFARLDGLVIMSFTPRGRCTGDFERGGFLSVCLPWISKTEWHPFSFFPSALRPGEVCVAIEVVGDWTRCLRDSLAVSASRPAYVSLPQPSAFQTSLYYDNCIAVATGIGVTPALHALMNGSGHRRVCLIWACRDPELIEFILANAVFRDNAWVAIYYTGTARNLRTPAVPPNVMLLRGRPRLRAVLPKLLANIEGGMGLPEHVVKGSFRGDAADGRRRFYGALAGAILRCGEEELFDMAADGDGAVSRASASTVLRGLLGASYAQAEMDRLFGFFDGGGGTIDREQMFRMLDFAKYELCDESPRAPAAHTFEETKELLDGAPAPALSRQGSYRTLSIGSAKTHVEKLERLADVEGGYTARNPERWQVLYCGNSKTLKAEVAEVARSLGLTSRFESFEH